MKPTLTAIIFCIIFTTCSDDDACPISNNLDLFDELWTTFDHEYAAFQILDKDWDKVRTDHRSLITENSSEAELFQVFKSMLFELEDAHSDLYTDSNLGNIQYYFELTNNSPKNDIGWLDLKALYLENLVETSDQLAYAKIKDTNIGYLKIADFKGESSQFDIADKLLTTYENLDGIIIDIRNNQGGAEANGKEIASNFIDTKTIYRYAKVKEGCDRNQLSEFKEQAIEPNGVRNYLGKVVLITNKKTFSAGEDFTLMMKATPNVIHIGDHTLGGFGTGPVTKTLSNGWTFRVSRKVNYDLNKRAIVGGIPPDEIVTITPEDSDNNVDRIIERAIEIIN